MSRACAGYGNLYGNGQVIEMKIIYSIGARFAGGGIGTIAYQAVRGLHQHGLLHRLLCGSFRPTDIPREKIRSVDWPNRALRKLATFDASKRLWYLDSLLFDAWSYWKLEPADLFLVWSNYGLRSIKRARAMGMMIGVNHASSHPLHQVRLLKEEWDRWGEKFQVFESAVHRAIAELETADYVLIPSEYVRHTFLNEDFPENRLLQIPFGVDIARFRPSLHRMGSPFRVLFAGQIGIRKGVPYLLEAWRELGWRDAELWLVGRVEAGFYPLLSRWQGLDGLKIIGYAADPVSLFQQADIFAFPTIEEGSALVTYEALACGLPVVTTSNAGSVVEDGVQGFIVPVRDVNALAERLEELRADEGRRLAMGRMARQRAEILTWERYGDTLSQHLANVGLHHLSA
jgi:glycosyltransferase involved in cell wall biosynthesis